MEMLALRLGHSQEAILVNVRRAPSGVHTKTPLTRVRQCLDAYCCRRGTEPLAGVFATRTGPVLDEFVYGKRRPGIICEL